MLLGRLDYVLRGIRRAPGGDPRRRRRAHPGASGARDRRERGHPETGPRQRPAREEIPEAARPHGELDGQPSARRAALPRHGQLPPAALSRRDRLRRRRPCRHRYRLPSWRATPPPVLSTVVASLGLERDDHQSDDGGHRASRSSSGRPSPHATTSTTLELKERIRWQSTRTMVHARLLERYMRGPERRGRNACVRAVRAEMVRPSGLQCSTSTTRRRESRTRSASGRTLLPKGGERARARCSSSRTRSKTGRSIAGGSSRAGTPPSRSYGLQETQFDDRDAHLRDRHPLGAGEARGRDRPER